AEVNRNRPLCEKGHLSEMEFLVTKTNAATAAADLKSAEAALSRSQTQLKYTEIRSPINGTVIERTIDEGQTIAANFQAPTLFIIAEDLTQMQIEVLVDESDIGLIRENQPARFTVQAYPEDVFVGTVRQIRLQPRTEQNVVNYTVVVDSSNTEGLLMPGMTATVDFVVKSRRNVLLVPNSALSFKPGKDVVKKYRKQLKANMKKNPNSSVRNMARSKLPDNMAMVFYMETDGTLAVTVVTKGASNLKYTEIASDPILRAGVSVVNGFKKEKETDSRDAAFTLPRPGGPGGPG
ncbi:MAG: efflux RND transporter periplasmic adaptor subunit, partial [bacterium]|nr:efflux RND transporter periplasmic adaptor subunit [bacterium]